MVLDRIKNFLINRGWQTSNENDNFTTMRPPSASGLPQDFLLHLPRHINKSDSNRFITNVIQIVADYYELTLEDLNVILKKENTILKVRVYDEQTEHGKIPLTRFEELIEKIRAILSDTASFVIDRSVTSARVPEEVSRYLNLCQFMQTETGSFVAKIQLPSRELIKDRELFDREEVYSEDINRKLQEILSYVNQNIFEGNAQVTEEYLIENASKINIKLYKDIETFFDKANLKNIDFIFHNIDRSNIVINQNITKQKLYKLTQFVEQIESHSYEVGNFTFTGRIIALKSKDPDGLRNSVTFSGIFDNLPMVATANLTSEDYKGAIEAHKLKQSITITGLAKRTKTRARFTEVTSFDREE